MSAIEKSILDAIISNGQDPEVLKRQQEDGKINPRNWRLWLAKRAISLPADKWATIPLVAQTWVNECLVAANDKFVSGGSLPKFGDEQFSEGEGSGLESDSGFDYSQRAKSRCRPGTSDHFRGLILDFPLANKIALMQRCADDGYPIPDATANTVYHQTHATLKLLFERNILKGKQ